MFPNNLLKIALSVLPKQPIEWQKFTGYTTDDRGREVATYADAVTLQGSVQPLEAKDYEAFGLDLNKRYYQVWSDALIKQTDRNQSPDKLSTDGMDLEVTSNTNWHQANDWGSLLCVQK